MLLQDRLRALLDHGHRVDHRPEQLARRSTVGLEPVFVRPDGEGEHELPGLLPPEAVQTHHLPVSFADQPGHQRLEDHQRIQLSAAEQGHQHRRRGERELEVRSEEHTSELQSRSDLVCRLLLEKKKKTTTEIQKAEATYSPDQRHPLRTSSLTGSATVAITRGRTRNATTSGWTLATSTPTLCPV